jgi:putative MATE family efflux protein
MNNTTHDLTQGSIFRHLITFGIPILLANFLQSLYSIVDMLVVGRFFGSVGLAAVSNGSMIAFVIISICIGISMGGSVIVARYKGAGDIQSQKESIGTLFSMSILLALAITIISLATYKTVLHWLKVPPEAMQETSDYVQVICAGTFFVFGYNAVCSVMRGLGDSRSPLYFVAIATIINVVLDLLFVGTMQMGTKGAAYATVISQAVSFLIAASRLRVFDFKWKSFVIQRDKLFQISSVAFPFAGQMVIVNISYLLVTGMLNKYGVSIAAATGIGLKVNTFAAMPCWAIGQAVITLVSQNLGAQKMNRVRDSVLTGLVLNLVLTGLTVLVVQLFARSIIMLFDPTSSEVVENGVLYLRICCSFNCCFYVAMYTFDSYATGIGRATFAMLNSLLESVVMRLLFVWILGEVFTWGFMGVYIGQAFSSVFPAILGAVFFYRYSRKME